MKQRFSKRTRLVSALLTLAMVFTFLPLSLIHICSWLPSVSASVGKKHIRSASSGAVSK